MSVLHGKNGAIYIDGQKVTFKTDWTLSLTREYADVTTFRDGNKVNAAGLMDVNGSFSGLLDTAGDKTIQKNDGLPHTVALYAEDGVTLIATGPAFIDAVVSVSVNDAVKVSGNFKAAGTWTIS